MGDKINILATKAYRKFMSEALPGWICIWLNSGGTNLAYIKGDKIGTYNSGDWGGEKSLTMITDEEERFHILNLAASLPMTDRWE